MATATNRWPHRSFRRPWLAEVREQGQAAVDEDRLPGDVRGVVGGQKRTDAGHLVRGGCPVEGDVARGHLRLDRVVGPGAVDRGDRGAGPDGVDADAVAGELERERLGQVLQTA